MTQINVLTYIILILIVISVSSDHLLGQKIERYLCFLSIYKTIVKQHF